MNVSESFGQTGVVLYPSKGSATTDILLEAYVPINSRNNIFWDDIDITLDVHRGQENYPLMLNIKVPNQHPYSDLGNHTITVESFYWDGSDKVMYMNTTFEIIEHVPCDEWLALNATYYEVLSDYQTLNASYNALQAQYDSLLSNYTSLLVNYNSLLSDHNSLLSSYDSLSDSYATMMQQYNSLSSTYSALLNAHNQLQSSYNSLSGGFSQLQSNFNSLKTSYDSLKSIHDSLKTNYDALESNNSDLTTSYNALVGDLAFTRNLSYVFAATTMLFIGTTVYFAVRKPKVKTS